MLSKPMLGTALFFVAILGDWGSGVSHSEEARQHRIVPLRPMSGDVEVIHGDPDVAGEPFVMRIRELPGTIIPPHKHPVDEHITVVQGTIYFAVGEKFDRAALKEIKTGGYAFIPKGSTMFGYIPDAAIVQVHGIGPFHIHWRAGTQWRDKDQTLDDPESGSVFKFRKGERVTTKRGNGRIRQGYFSGEILQYEIEGEDRVLYMANEEELQHELNRIGSELAAQEGPAKLRDTPIRWNGVEVVTNNFDSVDRIREVAGLPAGTVLNVADHKLQVVCDAVRKELSSSTVVCTNVIGARTTPEGPPTAWYIVEVDIKERESPACQGGDALPEDLMWLHESWQRALMDAIFGGLAVRERVNARKYLDYDHAELSSFADRLHVATEGRENVLEAAASSCEPTTRMSSFYLMNFTGDPQRFVQLAGASINDPHVGVANAATRFLMTFADFVPATEIPRLSAEACRSLQEGGFTARNKSLMLLNAWRKSKALIFDQLGPVCQRQVRNIARTSIAEQIALPARELLYTSDR